MKHCLHDAICTDHRDIIAWQATTDRYRKHQMVDNQLVWKNIKAFCWKWTWLASWIGFSCYPKPLIAETIKTSSVSKQKKHLKPSFEDNWKQVEQPSPDVLLPNISLQTSSVSNKKKQFRSSYEVRLSHVDQLSWNVF